MSLSAHVAGRGAKARWTRANIIEKIREWVAAYGEPPRSADWNPSAAKWSGSEWRIERYRSGDWPSLNAVKKHFDGSLNKAIREAGFEPNKPGPPARRKHAAPELGDRLVMSPAARVEFERAQAAERDALEKVAVREGQLERARGANDALREALAVARREKRPKAKPVVHTKTKTKVVREGDPRVVAKLAKVEAKLADAQALERAQADQRKASERELARLKRAHATLATELEEARSEAREADRARKGEEDRRVAAEAASAREKVVVREIEVRSASDQEVMDARRAVSQMERQVEEAEVRAAKAEREMREQGAAVTGESRKLTPAELNALRDGGPSGPAVLAVALKKLAVARAKSPAAVRPALREVASAAVRWMDSIQ